MVGGPGRVNITCDEVVSFMLQHVGNTQKKRRRIVAENTKAQSTSPERSKFKAAGEVIVRLDEEFWAEQPFPNQFVSKMSPERCS